jgi:quercetin dioxygenase-like cupin family protein
MIIPSFPFEKIDWGGVPTERLEGITGYALWQVKMVGDIRIRIVEYSAGYQADHWCKKGHIIQCLEGEMITQLTDGRSFTLTKGTGYIIGDKNEEHSSQSHLGCKLFIVD